MDMEKYSINGFDGYRFRDIAGRSCTLQQTTKGLMIGVDSPSGSARMHLDEESAMWLCRAILDYVGIGKI